MGTNHLNQVPESFGSLLLTQIPGHILLTEQSSNFPCLGLALQQWGEFTRVDVPDLENRVDQFPHFIHD